MYTYNIVSHIRWLANLAKQVSLCCFTLGQQKGTTFTIYKYRHVHDDMRVSFWIGQCPIPWIGQCPILRFVQNTLHVIQWRISLFWNQPNFLGIIQPCYNCCKKTMRSYVLKWSIHIFLRLSLAARLFHKVFISHPRPFFNVHHPLLSRPYSGGYFPLQWTFQ